MTKNPYYSIVIVGRNDNYGKLFLFRFKHFFKSLFSQIAKYKLSCEIILVEWNPPKGKKALFTVIEKSFSKTPAKIRVISVPNTIHRRFKNAHSIPLFEVIAKNVGIRRANGKFILATNPDVLYPDRLIQFLADHNLKSNSIYRVDRVDYKLDGAPKNFTVNNQFEIARKTAYLLHTFGCRVFLRTNFPFIIKLWLGYFNAILMRNLVKKQGKLLTPVHVSVAGDFTLMHKKHWFRVRGYPEKSTLSYFDTYPCFSAIALGLKQHVFGPRYSIFHLEHERLEKNIPERTSEARFHKDYYNVLHHKKSPIFNKKDWGFGKEKLKEKTLP